MFDNNNEQPHNTVEIVNCSKDCSIRIAELTKEIMFLKKEVAELRSSGRQVRQNVRNFQFVKGSQGIGRDFQRRPNRFSVMASVVCDNCKRTGHYASMCGLAKAVTAVGVVATLASFVDKGNK